MLAFALRRFAVCIACLLSLLTVNFPAAAQTPESFLGIRMVDVDADRAARLKLADESGVEVIAVVDESPAEKAGVQVGDALLSYNGENILGALHLIRLVRETPPGRKVRVQLFRGGKERTVTVVLSTMPALSSRALPPFMISPGGSPAATQMSGRYTVNVPEPGAEVPDSPVMKMLWHNTLLGVECEGIDSAFAHYFGVKQGLLVRSVEENGPGARAGLKAGDVLLSIGDRALASPRDLAAFYRLFRLQQGRTDESRSFPVALVRDRKNMKLSVTFAAFPE